MRTQTISLALAIVLRCPFASGQGVQTNGLNERQVPHHPLMGTNVSQESPRELSGFITQHRMQAGFTSRLDSLRANRMQSPSPGKGFIANGNERSPRSLRKMSSPQSTIYVIDTAIVRSVYDSDTTRHLYSFNAGAKRTSDVTQRLIAGLWVDTLRHTDTYDASNNMLSDLYEYRSTGQWVDSIRYTYTYDAGSNMLSSLCDNWSDGRWGSNYRYTYTYDASSNMLSSLCDNWSGGQWVNSFRNTYTYDAINNLLSDFAELWSNGQWVGYCKYTFIYDASGNMLSSLSEDFLDSYVSPCRFTYTYDASNNMLTDLTEQWSNGQWVNVNRWTYIYDTSNNMLSSSHHNWSNGQWVDFSRSTYTYDGANNMLSQCDEFWSNGQWLHGYRYTYTYDGSNDILLELGEVGLSGQWRNDYRRNYTYDAQGNLNSFWHYYWFNSSWTPTEENPAPGRGMGLPYTLAVTDRAGNSYSYTGYSVTFTRELIVTGAASQIGNAPAVYSLSHNYPNPFNPSTTIKFELPRTSLVNLSVYDILGRQVSVLVNERKEPGSYEVKFDGSALSSGVYFYRLQAGDFFSAKKMLVLK